MISTFIDARFEELEYYILSVSFLLFSALLMFAFYLPFRKGLLKYIRHHVFFITVFGLYLLTYVVSRLFFFEAFKEMYTEDGLSENLTAIFFLIAAVFFVLTFANSRKELSGYMKFVILTLAVLCFFTGMEEISWGQRILGIETPESMKELNYQQETTLHNLIDARFYTAIYIPISLLLLVYFAFKNTKYKSFFGVPREYMPSKKFLVIALLLPLICLYEKEHFEAVLSFLFCVYGYQLYQKSRNTVNIGTDSVPKNRIMLPTIRNTVFWLLDRLKGSKVRKHYNAIKKINSNHGSDFAISERKGYLSDMLLHCTETVPFYRNLEITDVLLCKFPIVDKHLIRKNLKSFRSDTYTDKKTFKVTTSGSTGTPFTLVHDAEKRKRHTADVLFFWEAVGHSWGTSFYYLKIWNKQNKKGGLIQKIQNVVPIDVFKLDDQRIKRLLERLRADGSPKSILGYASALDRIIKYLERNPTDMSDAGVISIIAMSESLDGPTKKALKEYFGCPVVSRYANIENGMLAQQTSGSGNDFLANLASYHIEILDMYEDIPVRDGETGRIVVTDLFNRAMPMIRYDTGDLGALGQSDMDGRICYMIKSVEGRRMDTIYDTRGEPISSFTITNNMWKYTELAQYQFMQVSKTEYEFRLNMEGNFLRKEELIKEFRGYLGSEAAIALTFVDEIPLLSSGKRRKVLNKVTIGREKKERPE